MKHFYPAILLIATGLSLGLAQTSTNAPAAHSGSPKLPRGPLEINADGPTDFDMNRHWATYTENVVVSDEQMKLTCEWIKANLPLNGVPITNILARTNVVMDFTDEKGQKTRATGDQAVYYFHVQNGVTNETVTLTANPPGKPKVTQGKDTMTGDAIIWDRTTDQVQVTGHFRGTLYPNTNSPAATNNNSILK
jgi:lipopolysaccharide transport protein LptA